MRSTFTTLFISLVVLFRPFAQPAETQAPRVIFKDTPRKTFYMGYVIPGGVANYDKSKEGIEFMAVKWAISGGITGQSTNQLAKKMDDLGMQLEASSELDYSTIEVIGLKEFWKESLDIFIEILTKPGMDQKAFESVKEDLALQAFYTQQEPEGRLFQLSMNNLFSGTDYSKRSEGTASSINQLESEEVSNYFRQLIATKKGFFVVVGNFSKEEKEQIRNLVSNASTGSDSSKANEPQQLPKSMSVTEAALETNYLRGLILSPELTEPDGFSMLMAIQVLNARIFNRIRSVEGLSYGPQAYYALGVLSNPYSVIQLDSESPLKAIQVIMEMLQIIKEEGITEKELIRTKSSYLTENYLSEETTPAQGQSLYLAALRNEYLITDQFNERINAVTVSEVNEVLKKYLTKVYWTYLGKNTEQFSSAIKERVTTVGLD